MFSYYTENTGIFNINLKSKIVQFTPLTTALSKENSSVQSSEQTFRVDT